MKLDPFPVHPRFLIPLLAAALCAGPLLPAGAEDEEDTSFEGLYQTAVDQNLSGRHAEASATFEKLFELSGGQETIFEDYGAQAGGLFFDYGMTLLPQQRWEDAKAVFEICIRADEIAKEVQSPVGGENVRKNLAKFQLGFAEAQLGNHEEAIGLYDEYLASEPPAEELAQVRNGFKLRYGASLMQLGRTDEGVSTIQELFDNREAWRVSPQFLMQGLLELGIAWTGQAAGPGVDEAEAERIALQINDFLDQNWESFHLSPLDQFRFGFVERLRKLGFEATRAGLYDVALRFFSLVPTVEDVREDLNLALARQPVGVGVPAQFQQLIDRLDEREKAPLHPDVETLRLVATCYERMGNLHGPRSIYWHLSEHHPDVEEGIRAEILHEASRLSSRVGDHQSAQYFGDKFMAHTEEDHQLRNNVATFMLQSLFTSGEYSQVISVAERVRERYEPGAAERELADSLYPLALYTTGRHEDAADPFAEYVRHHSEGANLEIVMFHRASNALVRGRMREAAELYEDFLKAFAESEQFLDIALSDLTVARFNLEDYSAAIAAADRLEAERPDSTHLPRALNIRGDAYVIQAGNLVREEEERRAEWRQAGLESYDRAAEIGELRLAEEPEHSDLHRETVSEGLWKATDLLYEDGRVEEGLARYDAFFPDYAGTSWEPQISVFSLEHLEEAGRGEEGLEQVERMIILLGGKEAEQQDLTLLRQAIGSWSEASERIRGVEETLAILDDFPGIDPGNQALLTWLKIQQVIVLQRSRRGLAEDSPELAAIETRINGIFEELREFNIRTLSEFALQQIGLHFAATDNPFLAVPYFEELLARENPEADAFKAPAEMELAKIEMRGADPAQRQSARERFRRVIEVLKDPAHIPEAYLNLARLHIASREWREALAALDVINKEKDFFRNERVKRAEAGFLFGTVFDELNEPVQANQAYLAVVSAFNAFPDWVTQAWERYIPNSIADFERMPTNTPEERLAKRERELALYRLTRRYLYQWQGWTDEDAPSGALRRLRRDIEEMRINLNITPEEESAILRQLGITQAN